MKITKIDIHIYANRFSKLDHLRENVIDVRNPNWCMLSHDNEVVMAGYLVDELSETEIRAFIEGIIIKNFDETIKFFFFAENRYCFELIKSMSLYTINCSRSEEKTFRICKQFYSVGAEDCVKIIMDNFKLMEKEFVLNSFEK
jgi:hypothetical protein